MCQAPGRCSFLPILIFCASRWHYLNNLTYQKYKYPQKNKNYNTNNYLIKGFIILCINLLFRITSQTDNNKVNIIKYLFISEILNITFSPQILNYHFEFPSHTYKHKWLLCTENLFFLTSDTNTDNSQIM